MDSLKALLGLLWRINVQVADFMCRSYFMCKAFWVEVLYKGKNWYVFSSFG